MDGDSWTFRLWESLEVNGRLILVRHRVFAGWVLDLSPIHPQTRHLGQVESFEADWNHGAVHVLDYSAYRISSGVDIGMVCGETCCVEFRRR